MGSGVDLYQSLSVRVCCAAWPAHHSSCVARKIKIPCHMQSTAGDEESGRDEEVFAAGRPREFYETTGDGGHDHGQRQTGKR